MIKNSEKFSIIKNFHIHRKDGFAQGLRLAGDIKKFLAFHLKVQYFLHKSSVGFGRKVPSF